MKGGNASRRKLDVYIFRFKFIIVWVFLPIRCESFLFDVGLRFFTLAKENTQHRLIISGSFDEAKE